MNSYRTILDRLSNPEVGYYSPDCPRTLIKLPSIPGMMTASLESTQTPTNRSANDQELEELPLKRRGAPFKLKNNLAEVYELQNLRGKPFKFSFMCQILVAHLQHLFDLKGKPRHNKSKWLRSYLPQGRALQNLILEIVGEDVPYIAFKRTVTISQLKAWLNGTPFSDTPGFNVEKAKEIRLRAFRAFCVLKSLDIEKMYMFDFNIGAARDFSGHVFRSYLLSTIWEEISIPKITEDEVKQTLESAKKYLI